MISRLEAWVFVVGGLLGITVKAARQGGSVDWCGGSGVKEKKKVPAVVEGGTDRSEGGADCCSRRWLRVVGVHIHEGISCFHPYSLWWF
jgi:hypothetical protein